MASILNPTHEDQMNVVRQFIGAISKLPPGTRKLSFNCEPYKTEDKATVWFTNEAWLKMCALIDAVGDKEVGWHAVVKRNDDIPGHNYMVSDILVYPQEVGAATVNTDQEAYQNWLNAFEDDVFNNIRGHFHSHVNFSPSPSSTDDAHVESLVKQLSGDMFYLFMIWNKKHEYTCRLYDLRENLYFENKDVEVKTVDVAGVAEFIADAKTKITNKVYTGVQVYSSAQSSKTAPAGSKSTTTSNKTDTNNKTDTKLPMRQRPVIGAGWRGGYDYDMDDPYHCT